MSTSDPWHQRARVVTGPAVTALALMGVAIAAPSASAAPSVTSRSSASSEAPGRAQGPCDIYAAGGTPCVAAHSSTRALYAAYTGPLYQVRRLSDGKTRDIGVVRSSASDAGGHTNTAAQDNFCANTTCFITTLYDQSALHNDLTQAPRGGFSGPAMGGANNLPIADMAPISLNAHKAYGVFIEPGMGLRNNDTHGIAVDDKPEGMYWVINGQHFNDGCCFDYGNAEIDSRDDGNGTMETSYFGNSTGWYRGVGPGPWVMTDQENNLVGCVNPGSTSKFCPSVPTITDRFVTAVAKGKPHHWSSLAGNAQSGNLTTLFDGPRIDASYDPMRKQGAIVLGNGGDNSNGSQGTFYEGVMTKGYPSTETDQKVQANVVAARYNVQRLSLTPASETDTPPGLQTFTHGASQDVTETFTNTSAKTATNVEMRLRLPSPMWKSVVKGTSSWSKKFGSVAPGASVSATFAVTSGPISFEGDLIATASWTKRGLGGRMSASTTENVRNISPIKINEFRIGMTDNPTDSFIELYNAGDRPVDVSGWTLTEHANALPVGSTIKLSAGTIIGGGKTYLLGLAPSGLAAPARSGARTVDVRSTTGFTVGDKVQIGTGGDAETRTITAITNTGATGPRVPGKIGNAVNLSGNGEYVALQNGIVSGLHDFTVSTWLNPADTSAWGRIFDFGSGTATNMFLTVNGGGAGLRFDINAGGVNQQLIGGGDLPLNTWSHVAVTLTGTTGRLYLNGNVVATNTNMTLHPSDLGDTNQTWIGRSQFVADPYLDATVDDFQIYDRGLTTTEVAALAGGQAGAGNVASYKLDETGGAKAVDSSGNGHDATIATTATSANRTTLLWQPVPDPLITVPAGSANIPVTSTSGFSVGQKMTIGYGHQLEVVTVTAVGTPGTQAYVVADAAAGATTLKVNSTGNISAGDTIRLDIGSRQETVTVKLVGTGGPTGTRLVLTAPLKFAHSSNLPFSVRGTGITFSPATRFAHSSNEPLQALGAEITLDAPLNKHRVDTPVLDAANKTAGYQGSPAPDEWFGGPALTSAGGSIALRNGHGVVADSLNFGRLVDPWLAEGYQATSGSGQFGCMAPVPAMGKSAARYPNGTDTDSNCTDFIVVGTPTPGASNTVALSAGKQVSLQMTTGGTTSYVRHNDTNDLVVLSSITASSSTSAKQDATFVETDGLADPTCVSFESVNRPGSYMRHFGFVMHLQPNDGSLVFAQDATFCPKAGNAGSGTSFQSVNFTTKFIRAYNGGVYVASNGGTNPWDATASFAQDTTWFVASPLAPAAG